MALSMHLSYSSVLKGGPGTPGALSGVKTAFLTVLNVTAYGYAAALSTGYLMCHQLNAEIRWDVCEILP